MTWKIAHDPLRKKWFAYGIKGTQLYKQYPTKNTRRAIELLVKRLNANG